MVHSLFPSVGYICAVYGTVLTARTAWIPSEDASGREDIITAAYWRIARSKAEYTRLKGILTR